LLSFHLLDSQEKILQFDNRRFHLQPLAPGEEQELEISVLSPLQAGEYVLEFDLLREGIAWFKDSGSGTSTVTLHVQPRDWPDCRLAFSLDYGKYTRFESSLPEIAKIYRLIRLTLENNEVEYQGKSSRVSGFSPGTNYPQIWLRDANTILPASRFLYGRPFLSSWIEEHLRYQTSSGSLQDWIDARGITDKNTTETDQETSAVQAAYQVYGLLGSDWLQTDIQGKAILDRLELALRFVWETRLSPETGLITGAHTADWGDVDLVDADQQAVYVDERTIWTTDIYDQSMFYLACLNLSEMLEAVGAGDRSAAWKEKAQVLKQRTNDLLWQPGRGFYRVHHHLSDLRHDFDEDNIFAMGGNTMAVLAGLAAPHKTESIIQTALTRQPEYKVSTISGTLLPPYPAGTFAHPLLDDPYEYQNGAQWDWFGAKLIYAMFEYGFSRPARIKLLEVMRKNLVNRGFYEWENLGGAGVGSDLFCGSAGSLARAVIEGYFGIKPIQTSFALEPKLAGDSARIHLYQPAGDSFIAYTYSFNPDKQNITFRYNSNVPILGRIRILSPWEQVPETLSVIVSDRTIPFDIERKAEDLYIVFRSDHKDRTVTIQR
jgi:hypothetical protein